jgi:uracil-DNA glycosylase family 4
MGRTMWFSGESNLNAGIMIIGEAPGSHEDKTGKPFVGAAGKYMQAAIDKLGLTRDVYITNIIKCRPPGNRDPSPQEKANCYPYLQKQIELIDPKVIITIGRHSFSSLIPDHQLKITKEEGKIFHYETNQNTIIPVIPMLHPAYMLRQKGNKTYPELRDKHWANWKRIKEIYEKTKEL